MYLVKKINHFWSRWRNEYLVDLREVHRNNGHKIPDISIGDVVQVKEDNVKRGQWKMGVVVELIKDKTGIARGAKVRVNGKGKLEILNRPLQKLFPFEVQSQIMNGKKEVEKEKDDPTPLSPRIRSKRAAAKDSQWKTRLVLDSI